MLELAILGLLLEVPMHGYELAIDGAALARFGRSRTACLPALRRMQADGLIAEDVAPAGTTVLRRARRVYQLTDAGRRASPNWWPTPVRRTTPTTGSACTWRSSTARRPRRRMRILEGRRRQVEDGQGGSAEAIARASNSFDRYTRQLHQLGLESSEREVKWLND